MYVPEFIVGVASTILFEIALLVIGLAIYEKKNNKR